MSEIMVSIPATLLGGTDVSNPTDVADTLSKIIEVHANLPRLQQSATAAIQKVRDIGTYLNELLSEPTSSMERAQKLRQLVIDCRNYGGV